MLRHHPSKLRILQKLSMILIVAQLQRALNEARNALRNLLDIYSERCNPVCLTAAFRPPRDCSGFSADTENKNRGLQFLVPLELRMGSCQN